LYMHYRASPRYVEVSHPRDKFSPAMQKSPKPELQNLPHDRYAPTSLTPVVVRRPNAVRM